MIARYLFFPALLGLLFTLAFIAPSENGRVLVVIERGPNGISIVSSSRLDPGPLPAGAGDIVARILDEGGHTLAQARTSLPAVIAQERFSEDGTVDGHLTPVRERRNIVLPLPAAAREILLEQNGGIVSRRRFEPLSLPRMTTATADATQPVRFRPLLRGRDSADNHSVHSPAPGAAAGLNMVVSGEVILKTVKDRSRYYSEIRFNAQDGSGASFFTRTDKDGKFSVSLPRGIYQVVGNCWYNDASVDNIFHLLYPGPQIIPAFDSADKTLTLKWKKNVLFKGRVVDSHKHGLPADVYVIEKKPGSSLNQLWYSMYATAGEDGAFSMVLPARAHAFVIIPRAGSGSAEQVRIVTMKKPKKGRKVRTVNLQLPDIGTVGGDALKKVQDAGPEDKRLNIVFLAEAYTDAMEAFTDLNSNGVWDGDLLLDENGNDSYDEGEYYYDRNRNGIFDRPEPFEDDNGDGICNRNERARFEADATLAATALLNFPPYNGYRDAVNVWLYWVPSKDGMHRLANYTRWQNMETAFGVVCYGTGGFQNSSVGSDVSSFARGVLPNAGTIVPVVLSQDTFHTLRANAIFSFGRVLLSAEDHRAGAVLIHELGHSIGYLGDEYLYNGAPPAVAPAAYEPYANVTAETDPELVKWRDLFRGTPPVPSPFGYDAYGLFEGAGSWNTGYYRPTENSMMRNTSYPYFEVNSRRLREVLAAFRD